MGYAWFCVFVSLVATKTGSRPQCDCRDVGFVFLVFLVGFPMCFPCPLSWLALFSPLLKQVGLDPVRCMPKSVVSYFWGCRVNFPRCFPFFSKAFALVVSILCSLCLLVGLGIKKSHLKLICFVSVSSVLFVP